MTQKVDSAGRVLIPKPLRDRLGLRSGSNVDLAEEDGELRLRRCDAEPALVEDGPFLLHTGRPQSNFDIVEAIREEREERIRHILGL